MKHLKKNTELVLPFQTLPYREVWGLEAQFWGINCPEVCGQGAAAGDCFRWGQPPQVCLLQAEASAGVGTRAWLLLKDQVEGPDLREEGC